MTKTEAADIIATNIAVWCRRHDRDDAEITNLMIAEAISRCRYESEPGSLAQTAAEVRPADRTVRIAYRRNAGLL